MTRNIHTLQTREELLEAELEWEKQEEDIDLFAWWEQGIELYRKLSRLEPKNERYKIQQANLLLKAGGDLKIRQSNFSRARRLFHELIRMEPEHAIAHYRLGFLWYYEQDWEKSIRYLKRALELKPAKSSQQINREQEMKALCYLAKAYQKLSLSAFEQANQKFQAERDPAVADAVDSFIQDAKSDLFAYEESKPYVVVTHEQTLYMSEYELLRFLENEVAPDEVRLDLLGEKMYLTTPFRRQESSEVSEQLAKLLRLLMESKRPLSTEAIRERIFPDSKSDSIVRRTIRRLREALARLYLPADLIVTTRSGYQWNWPGRYTIIYRKDDMFLQDILHN